MCHILSLITVGHDGPDEVLELVHLQQDVHDLCPVTAALKSYVCFNVKVQDFFVCDRKVVMFYEKSWLCYSSCVESD